MELALPQDYSPEEDYREDHKGGLLILSAQPYTQIYNYMEKGLSLNWVPRKVPCKNPLGLHGGRAWPLDIQC